MTMKKLLCLVLILLMWQHSVQAQFSTESKTGSNAILLNNSAATFNITDPKISVDWTSLPRFIEPRNRTIFGNLGASAKNKTGIAKIFEKNRLTAESEVHGVLGVMFSNAVDKGTKNQRNSLKDAKFARRLFLLAKFSQVIDAYTNNLPVATRKQFRDILDKKKKNLKDYVDDFATLHKSIATPHTVDLVKMHAEIDKIFNDPSGLTDIEQMQQAISEYHRNNMGSGYYRIMPFIFGNINSSNFKQISTVDTVNLQKSFKEIDFTGKKIGFGVNIDYKIFKFGLTYAWNFTNNFASLEETDFILRTTSYSSLGQSITREKKTTTYEGNYGEVLINELNIDLTANLKLNKKGSNFLIINPYSHSTNSSRTPSKLPGTWNLGIGAYTFKKDGKFLGGLYVEFPDIKNAVEKNKDIDKQDLKPVSKRFVVGLVAKFTLNGIYFW